MNKVLVDSSVWISFFKGREEATALFPLLETNQICTNDLILAELIPSLNLKKELELIRLLQSVEKIRFEPEWPDIIHMQTMNLKNGLNKVGIPDLMIAQNAIQAKIYLFSLDKHFELMSKHIGLRIFSFRDR